MSTTQYVDNPFALLLDPQSVVMAMEKSERLERLHRRICRPLDKPLLPVKPGVDAAKVEIIEDEEIGDDEIDVLGEELG